MIDPDFEKTIKAIEELGEWWQENVTDLIVCEIRSDNRRFWLDDRRARRRQVRAERAGQPGRALRLHVIQQPNKHHGRREQ